MARLSPLALLLLLVACGDDAPSTTMPTDGARLVAVSDLTQVLRFDERADLRVRYEQADGSVITGAVLDWEVMGFAGDAMIGARQSTTDGSGESTVPVTAGAAEVSFNVRVTPPLGDPLDFQVAITDEDSGSIRVDLGYAGSGPAPFDTYEAFLFQDMDCASFDASSLPTALFAATPVMRLSQSPTFVPVTAGSGYAVAVQASESGAVTGFGCSDGISVDNLMETRVPVTIEDVEIDLIVEGVYELDNQFDFGEALPGSIRTGVDVIGELFDDEDITGATPDEYGQDPGAFVTDFVMRQTCHWECMSGEEYETCSELNHPVGDISALYLQNFRSWDPQAQPRFFGGCGGWEDVGVPVQNLINGQIATYVPDSITAWGVIASDLATAINRARFTSRLTVDQPSDGDATFIHELLDMHVTVHDLEGTEHDFSFDVLDAGLGGRPRSMDTLIMVSGNTVELPMHGFDLDYGVLVRYIYVNGILPAIGYDSSAEMLRDWVDCMAVGTTLESNIGILDAMTYADYCDTALGAAGTFLDFGVDGVIGAEGVLTLQGTATAGDPMPDGTATTLNDGVWMGGWGEGSGESGDVAGTFSGTRQ
jgi:hypothetical protein